ncbi:unnamed protein product [Coregonus sp. 'balchen']|nr:unnamed protein product [Coregonus sp. 'balchen']
MAVRWCSFGFVLLVVFACYADAQPNWRFPPYNNPQPHDTSSKPRQPQWSQLQTPLRPEPQGPQQQTPQRPEPQGPQQQTLQRPEPQWPQLQTSQRPKPQGPQLQTPQRPEPQRPLLLTPQTTDPHRPQLLTPQRPEPQWPAVTKTLDQRCQVEAQDTMQCGTPDITPAQCQAIDCYFNGQQCYYGKAVTVQCTRDAQFVVVVAMDATWPKIDIDSIKGNQNITDLLKRAGFLHPDLTHKVAIFSLSSLLFQCKYSATAVEALVIEVNTVPAPAPVAAPGPLTVEHATPRDSRAFTLYYTEEDYPLTKVLRQPVYVEVRILRGRIPTWF